MNTSALIAAAFVPVSVLHIHDSIHQLSMEAQHRLRQTVEHHKAMGRMESVQFVWLWKTPAGSKKRVSVSFAEACAWMCNADDTQRTQHAISYVQLSPHEAANIDAFVYDIELREGLVVDASTAIRPVVQMPQRCQTCTGRLASANEWEPYNEPALLAPCTHVTCRRCALVLEECPECDAAIEGVVGANAVDSGWRLRNMVKKGQHALRMALALEDRTLVAQCTSALGKIVTDAQQAPLTSK